MFHSLKRFIKDDSRMGKNRKWLITSAVFFVLASFAIIIIPWRETWKTLINSNLILIAIATLTAIPVQLLSTASYYVVASQQKISQNFWFIFKINLIMVFYGIVLPSTFFVSGLRWYRYNQHSQKPTQIITVIAYLKAFKILFASILSFGLLLLFDTTTLQGYTTSIIALIIGLLLILFLFPIASKKILDKLTFPGSSSTQAFTQTNFYKYFYKILAEFAGFQSLSLKTQFLLIIYELANQGIQYYSYLLIAESVGINLTLAQLGTIRAVLLLVANLPVNFSVGISMKDLTLVALLAAINIPMEQAAAMSIVVMAKNFFFGIIGGIIETFELIIQKKKSS